MQLSFLRLFDHLFGSLLLYGLALPTRLARFFLAFIEAKPQHVFLKLKGGGSLIIALPALLGLRQKNPETEFVLVCAQEAQIYAELTGIFDRFVVIDDSSLIRLLISALSALRTCFHTRLCVDLEPNSTLATVFTMMTCSIQRIGLVKPEQAVHKIAYSSAISFNSISPIYIYYDRICELLGGIPFSAEATRDYFSPRLPIEPIDPNTTETLALAPFTSEFARERMMPPETWGKLLTEAYAGQPLNLLIFGSSANKSAAHNLSTHLRSVLPQAQITDISGSGTLRQAAARLNQCDAVWAIDSGLLHIARLLGRPCHSFWGPTMPSQRLRPTVGLAETVHYRPFLCSPCIQASTVPPCGGNNLCMISMAEQAPNLSPSWVSKQ